MIPEFQEFKKIPRLNRKVIITEKIDGTNGVVYVGEDRTVLAGSRHRWLIPDGTKTWDNFGFGAWVQEHQDELRGLGPGFHHGEWWGKGIARNYGLQERRFSLFNVSRWNPNLSAPDDPVLPACCYTVPLLNVLGVFDSVSVATYLDLLRHAGSMAVPGYLKPEGIVLFHTASGAFFKVTLEGDEQPKSMAT